MTDYKIRNTVKSRARMSFYTLYGNGRGAEKSFNVRMINSPCTRSLGVGPRRDQGRRAGVGRQPGRRWLSIRAIGGVEINGLA